jgi:hypothetical protein
MSRRASEVLKGEGKPKMILGDGLQGRQMRSTRGGLGPRKSANRARGMVWRVARDQPARAAEVPARELGTCLTVVTTAKMTAIANAKEKAAKTKRGTT